MVKTPEEAERQGAERESQRSNRSDDRFFTRGGGGEGLDVEERLETLYDDVKTVMVSTDERLDLQPRERQGIDQRRQDVSQDPGGLRSLETPILQARASLLQLDFLSELLREQSAPNSVGISGMVEIKEQEKAQPLIPASRTNVPETKELFLKAHESNSDPITIGGKQVIHDEGFILQNGEFLELPLDISSGSDLWVVSPDGTAKLRFLGLS